MLPNAASGAAAAVTGAMPPPRAFPAAPPSRPPAASARALEAHDKLPSSCKCFGHLKINFVVQLMLLARVVGSDVLDQCRDRWPGAYGKVTIRRFFYGLFSVSPHSWLPSRTKSGTIQYLRTRYEEIAPRLCYFTLIGGLPDFSRGGIYRAHLYAPDGSTPRATMHIPSGLIEVIADLPAGHEWSIEDNFSEWDAKLVSSTLAWLSVSLSTVFSRHLPAAPGAEVDEDVRSGPLSPEEWLGAASGTLAWQ